MIIAFLAAFVVRADAAETFNGRQYFYGDLHSHTCVTNNGGCIEENTDCSVPARCGTLANVFTTAVANGLDFLGMTDRWNSQPADTSCPGASCQKGYNPLLALCRAAKTSTFVCIPAAELELGNSGSTTSTTGQTIEYGHKNVFVFNDNDGVLAGLSITNMGLLSAITTNCATQGWANATALQAFGSVLEFAHHPASINVMTTDWRCNNPTFEPVVEAYGGWGTGLNRTYGYDDVYQGASVNDAETGDVAPDLGTVFSALQTYALKVGFVGGTDDHSTRPGEMCTRANLGITNGQIYAGGLTEISMPVATSFLPSTIYTEISNKRALVTTGPRIPVEVTWTTSDTVTHTIGTTFNVEVATATRLDVKFPTAYDTYVTGVQAVGFATRIPLARTASGAYMVSIQDATLPAWLYVEVAINGATYLPSCLLDGGSDFREFVWSSPVWFTQIDSRAIDADGDGWTRNVDCDDTNVLIHPLAVDVLNNGIDEDCKNGDATGTPPAQ